MIVYISIGNSDDKLTQKEWAHFIADVEDDIQGSIARIHGSWLSASDVPWQNACWCIELDETAFNFKIQVQRLKGNLRSHAQAYRQDSIAWAEVRETELLG